MTKMPRDLWKRIVDSGFVAIVTVLSFFSFFVWHIWNESGFRPPLCTYRLNWARRTSWVWWDDWDDTVLQTQDSKFEPWRSEAEHATSRSRRLPTILTFTRGWGRNIFCFFQTAGTGNRTPDSGVKGSGGNHYPRAPALFVWRLLTSESDVKSHQKVQIGCFTSPSIRGISEKQSFLVYFQLGIIS